MPTYRIVEGDCLSSLAFKNKLKSWRTIYDHPNNADFRRLRPDPNLVQPGDIVFIPARETRIESGSTEQRHTFRRPTDPVYLTVKLLDHEFNAMQGQGCEVRIDVQLHECQTDASGKMGPLRISPAEQVARLTLLDDETAEPLATYDLQLGHLDPIDEISGVQGRLRNLGIDCGPVDGIDGPLTRAGVKEFQRAFGLAVDGIAGPITKGRLEEVHDR